MRQLLTQMREERNNLPLPIEWGRAYQAIEMMIEHTYIPMEKEQMVKFYIAGCNDTYGCDEPSGDSDYDKKQGEQYYNKNYGGDK